MHACQVIDANQRAESHESWHVYCLNDHEWWLARSLDEAMRDAARFWGYTLEEAIADELFDEPYELDAKQLDRLSFIDDSVTPEARRTFADELELRVGSRRESGLEIKPQLFACTDW